MHSVMVSRMASGSYMPEAHDWDARAGVVDDGTGKVLTWTDQKAGVATTAPSANRPTINTTIVPGVTTIFNSSTSGLTGSGLSDVYNLRQPISVTMRLRLTQISTNMVMFSVSSGTVSNRVYGTFNPGTPNVAGWSRTNVGATVSFLGAAVSVLVNTWHTLGWTWADGVASIFRDGAHMGDGAVDNTIAASLTSITIGCQIGFTTQLRGYIGRLRLYPGVISAAQHARDHLQYSPVWA
jgi:hypothetical protein